MFFLTETENKEFNYAKNDELFFVTKEEFKVLDYFKPEELYEDYCFFSPKELDDFSEEEKEQHKNYRYDETKDKKYFENLLSGFSEKDKGVIYEFRKIKPIPEDYGVWTLRVVSNKLNYSDLDEFKRDFNLCYTGGERYPFLISENYLLFEADCGGGARGLTCIIRDFIKPTIELK